MVLNILAGNGGTPSANTLTRNTLVTGVYGCSMLSAGLYLPKSQGVANKDLVPSGIDFPAAMNVRNGVEYGNFSYTGTMIEPAEADVKTGVQYGAGGTEFTGSYAGGGGPHGWTY